MSRYDEEVRAHISPGSESILPSETRRGRDALAPCACVTPGVNSSMKSNGMADESPAGWRGASRRCVFPACPGAHLWFQVSGCPTFTGGFFGKPLHTISRFRHQDAQPPPSPRVGEGGRGDERANTPNLPLRPVWEKGGGGMRGQTRPTSPFAPCGRRGAGG